MSIWALNFARNTDLTTFKFYSSFVESYKYSHKLYSIENRLIKQLEKIYLIIYLFLEINNWVKYKEKDGYIVLHELKNISSCQSKHTPKMQAPNGKTFVPYIKIYRLQHKLSQFDGF